MPQPLDSKGIAEIQAATVVAGAHWNDRGRTAALTDVMYGLWSLTTAIYEVARQVAKLREQQEANPQRTTQEEKTDA